MMRIAFGRVVAASLLSAGLLLGTGGSALAQARTPLLMEGKTSLYQKVLTRPGAKLQASPTAAARARWAV